MRQEVLEAEAVEEVPALAEAEAGRPLPVTVRIGEITAIRDEARTVVIAAAGGIVAGAATVAIVKAASRVATPSKRSKRTLLGRQKRPDVIASRSFLVDVHLLGR